MNNSTVPSLASIRAYIFKVKTILSDRNDEITTEDYFAELANHKFDLEDIGAKPAVCDPALFGMKNGKFPNSKSRAEFSIQLHKALNLPTRAMGSDERIWFSITHEIGSFSCIASAKQLLKDRYPQKIQRRELLERIWAKPENQTSKSKHIWGSYWWSAELTKLDNFKYTPTVWFNTDVQLQLMDRRIVRNEALRYAILDELMSRTNQNPTLLTSQTVQETLKQISRLCQAYPLHKPTREIQKDSFFQETLSSITAP